MNTIAIELKEDKKFAIVTKEVLSKTHPIYSKAERSILEIIFLIYYLIDSKLVQPFQFNEAELETIINEKKIIRIYDKDKYSIYTQINTQSAMSDCDELEIAMCLNKYYSKTTVSDKIVKTFFT
jgi:hypothetical protein